MFGIESFICSVALAYGCHDILNWSTSISWIIFLVSWFILYSLTFSKWGAILFTLISSGVLAFMGCTLELDVEEGESIILAIFQNDWRWLWFIIIFIVSIAIHYGIWESRKEPEFYIVAKK